MKMKTFAAPWSSLLIGISVLATVICIGIVILGVFQHRAMVMGAAPLALMMGCALFTVRGYAITPEAILVKRLFWDTRLPRAGLESATFLPGAMKGSLRTCGNGGFYSFTGRYWNRGMGNYRAFVTDGARSVVLRYAGRTFVVSPGDPEGFVRELTAS